MKFISKNWIILLCISIIALSIYLIVQKWASFSFPKGGLGTILSLTVVAGTDFILSKLNKKYGENYTRRIDRVFIYITVPVVIFTSVGLFQKIQQNNFVKELQNVAENRIQGIETEKKFYSPIKYGMFTPFLEMINQHADLQKEKEKEYLTGLDEIHDMISPENLYAEVLRNQNRQKLNNLLVGVEKYRLWAHSDMRLREEKVKKMEYGGKVIDQFHRGAKASLELNDELMTKFKQLITKKLEIIKFVDKYIEQIRLVDEELEWDNEKLKISFEEMMLSIDNDIDDLKKLLEEFDSYDQKNLENVNNLLKKDSCK